MQRATSSQFRILLQAGMGAYGDRQFSSNRADVQSTGYGSSLGLNEIPYGTGAAFNRSSEVTVDVSRAREGFLMSYFQEVIADPTKRAQVCANFAIPQPAVPAPYFCIGPGSISLGGNQHNFPGGFIGIPPQTLFPGNPGYNQVYIESSFGTLQIIQVTSASSLFPAGSLPLCVVVTDAVARVQQVIDMRPYPIIS